MSVTFTKRFAPIILLVICSHVLFAADDKIDSLKQQTSAISIDSLKKQLKLTVYDSLKGPIYTQIATQYLKYGGINDKKKRTEYQDEAIRNTLSAIHFYSKYNDTTGLRISFDNLAKVYHAQKKYPQAKWFILQSNTLSRARYDDPNIIASLLELASIKSDIKDYTLAMRDLDEALQLSAENHYSQQESEVQLRYAMLYNTMKNYTKASVAMKRHKIIDDSIKRSEEARMMAQLRITDSIEMAKKKGYMISSNRPYMLSLSKRLASLEF